VNSVHATSQVRFEETDTERQTNLTRLGLTSTKRHNHCRACDSTSASTEAAQIRLRLGRGSPSRGPNERALD
jgi:hypothetical protein